MVDPVDDSVTHMTGNTLAIDGWMTCNFSPFHQYFSHIRTMRG